MWKKQTKKQEMRIPCNRSFVEEVEMFELSHIKLISRQSSIWKTK
jgi:hypothetical protein